MTVDEVLPSIGCTVWSWSDSFLFENISDCLTTDPFDPQFPNLAKDPGVPEIGGGRDLDHQFSNLSRLPLTSLGILLSLGWPACVSQPPVERAGADNRDQFLDGSANDPPKLDQPLPLFRAGVDHPRKAGAEDLVLFLEELDVLGQLAIGGRSDQGQQGVKKEAHLGIVGKCNMETDFTFLVPRLDSKTAPIFGGEKAGIESPPFDGVITAPLRFRSLSERPRTSQRATHKSTH